MTIPPKRLTIMQGIPGSGKSTVARELLKSSPNYSQVITGVILSTDDFWTTPHPHTSMANTIIYNYDPARIAEAHQWNQRRCVEEMQKKTNYIFIDNTNIERWQAQPYLALANMFGYAVQVVSVSCGLDEALRRNQARSFDRRVPEAVIREMHSKLEPIL